MSELEQLRQEVSELREWKGAHEEKLDTLEERLAANTRAVEELVATMNRGKGAMWAFGIVAVGVGSIVTALIEWVRH